MDKNDILEIMQSVDSSSIAEVRIKDGEFELTVKKTEEVRRPAYQPEYTTGGTERGESDIDQSLEAHADADRASTTETETITAPVVGTFYRAPSPDSPPYIEDGAEVEEGQTLCIIEAMKVMNELEAEFPCRIVRVLSEDKKMVEYGTPLFEVERLG